MANILFASNNIAHFIGSSAGSVAGTFDPTRVPYSIQLGYEELSGSPVFTPSANGITWFHFMSYSTGVSNSFDDMFLFSAKDVNDNLLFDLYKDGSNTGKRELKLRLYDGFTNQNDQSVLQVPNNMLVSFDIRFESTPTLLSIQVFINNAKLFDESFGTNGNSYGDPNQFVLGGAFANTNTQAHFSEILVADESTVNCRLDMLRPLGSGGNSDWNGSLETLGDDDRTSGMTTLTAAQRQTMTMDPYSGAANVSNFVAVSTSTRGLNAPTKLSHTIRMGGGNYDGTQHDVPFEAKYLLTDYNINPATSLGWTAADIASAEVGFLSVA